MLITVGGVSPLATPQANSYPRVCIVIGCDSVHAQLAGRSTKDYPLTSDGSLARQRAIFLLSSVPDLPAEAALALCVCSSCYNHAKKRATTQPGGAAGTLSDDQLTQLALIEYVLGRVLQHMSPRVAFRVLCCAGLRAAAGQAALRGHVVSHPVGRRVRSRRTGRSALTRVTCRVVSRRPRRVRIQPSRVRAGQTLGTWLARRRGRVASRRCL